MNISHIRMALCASIALGVTIHSPTQAQYYGVERTTSWAKIDGDIRIPMAGIRNTNDAYVILFDYAGYGGASCEVFRTGEEGAAVTQHRMEIAIPSSRIPRAMINEMVSQHPDHMVFRALLSVFDGYEGSPNIVNVRAENTGPYWTFTFQPEDQDSLSVFRDTINSLRSGQSFTFQIWPLRDESSTQSKLPVEQFTLKGSAAAMKEVLTGCSY